METLNGILGVVFFIVLIGLLFRSLSDAQKSDNRNSNSNQSSYTDVPADTPGF